VIAVDGEDRQHFVGLITRAASFAAYDRALEHSV
jgi:hypothetical protein